MSTLLTVQDVAEKLRVDPRTIRAYIKKGVLAGIKLPGSKGEYRFKPEHLEGWLDKRTLKAKAI